MLNRGEGGRNELNERVVPKYEKLHGTGIALLNPCGYRENVEQKVPKTNNPIRGAMQVPHQPEKGGMEVHMLEDPEKILTREGGEGRGYIKGKDATIRDIPYNEIDNLGLKCEYQVNHLLSLYTTSLERGDAIRTDRGEKERDHAGDDFAISIGKIKGSGFIGMAPTVTRLISINTPFLDKHKP